MSKTLWQGRWQGRNPAGDSHRRARKIISPSGGIVRGKFPSGKNGRMVHHEGLLELDAIYLFETSPEIIRYREQPITLHYPDGPRLRRYTPDFELLLVTGVSVMIEVKPTRFLEMEDTRNKFERVEEYMRRSGIEFVILTDKIIRNEPRLSSLRWIYHQAARVPPEPEAARVALRKHFSFFPASIRSVHTRLAPSGIEPFSLLLSGLLRCSLAAQTTYESSIHIAEESDNGWFWISKEHAF